MRFMQHVDHVLINSHSNRRKLHDIGHKTMNTYSFSLWLAYMCRAAAHVSQSFTLLGYSDVIYNDFIITINGLPFKVKILAKIWIDY